MRANQKRSPKKRTSLLISYFFIQCAYIEQFKAYKQALVKLAQVKEEYKV